MSLKRSPAGWESQISEKSLLPLVISHKNHTFRQQIASLYFFAEKPELKNQQKSDPTALAPPRNYTTSRFFLMLRNKSDKQACLGDELDI